MNRNSFYTIATVVLPLVCLLVAVGLVFFEWHRLHQLQDEQRQTEAQIALLDKTMRDMEAHPTLAKVPTVAETPQEQPDFLNRLRMQAATTGVQLVRWSNAAAPAPGAADSGNGSAKAQASTPLAGVTPIASSVEVVGHYPNIRGFLYSLTRSPRLLNLTGIKWARENQWPQTRLTFTLTRYVTPQTAGPGGQ